MFLRLLLGLVFALVSARADTQIDWISTQNATNVTSDGVTAMDSGFRFELGVFLSGFTPTSGNTSEWVGNWYPVQRTSYRSDLKRYAASFLATNNTAPFTAGTPAYIWGFRGDPVAGEWILFRANSWVWPTVASGPPEFQIWDAKDATAVTGTISATGSPALMRSGAVSDLPPPNTSYEQWVIDELQGESLVAGHEDADGDGTPNIFEFILGTQPKVKNASILFPSSLVDISGSRYLQITVPRRIDRPAVLTVQVSGDLNAWVSGAGNTVQVSSMNSSLVVRDLIPVSPMHPQRFIRLRGTSN